MPDPLSSSTQLSPRHACCHCAGAGTIKRLAGGVLLLGAFPLAHAFTPFLLRDAIPLCPFRIVTGKPCPLCGLTRAIAQATHGRWQSAFALNALWPAFAAMMILLGLLLVNDAVTGRRSATRLLQILAARWVEIVVALILFGAWRIAFGSPGVV